MLLFLWLFSLCEDEPLTLGGMSKCVWELVGEISYFFGFIDLPLQGCGRMTSPGGLHGVESFRLALAQGAYPAGCSRALGGIWEGDQEPGFNLLVLGSHTSVT